MNLRRSTLLGTWAILAAACGDDASEPSQGNSGGSTDSDTGGRTSGGGSNDRGGSSSGGVEQGEGGSSSRGGAASGQAGQSSSEGGSGGESSGAEGGTDPGPVASLLPAHGSGTRLQTRIYESGDMPPVFVSFHDTELDVDCAVRVASDGSQRCLPTTGGTDIELSEARFLDDQCSQPIAIGEAGCAPEDGGWAAVATSPAETCDATSWQIYRATPLAEGAPLYSNEGGDCIEVFLGEPWIAYEVEEVSPSLFVGFSTQIAESDGPLSVQRKIATDGAFRTLALADVAAMQACRIYPNGDGSGCVAAPADSARDYRSSDPECSVPLTLPECEAPLYVIDRMASEYLFYEAGSLHEGPIYGGTGVCEELTGDEGRPAYTVGEPVDAGTFPVVESERAGAGRLKHNVFRDARGTALAPGSASGVALLSEGGLFDADLGEDCEAMRGADGRAWCVPFNAGVRLSLPWLFSDAACSEQLVECGDAECTGDLALRNATASSPASCGQPVPIDFDEAYTIGEAFAGSEVYQWFGSGDPSENCEGPLGAEMFLGLHAVAGAGDLASFVELEESLE